MLKSTKAYVEKSCDKAFCGKRELCEIWWTASSDVIIICTFKGCKLSCIVGNECQVLLRKENAWHKKTISPVLLHQFWSFVNCPSWVQQCYKSVMLNQWSSRLKFLYMQHKTFVNIVYLVWWWCCWPLWLCQWSGPRWPQCECQQSPWAYRLLWRWCRTHPGSHWAGSGS